MIIDLKPRESVLNQETPFIHILFFHATSLISKEADSKGIPLFCTLLSLSLCFHNILKVRKRESVLFNPSFLF
jgi:hypothetical protein